MKMPLFAAASLLFLSSSVFAEAGEAAVGSSIVVVVPEKIGEDTLLIGGGGNETLIVQGDIEKRLVRKGLDVRDVSGLEPKIEGGASWQTLTVKQGALTVARQVKADYLVYGQATAVRAGKGQAYGVTSLRAQADVVVRLVEVESGKVLEVFDSSALEGDQAFGIAAKRALKEAAKPLSREVADAAEILLAAEE